MTPRPTAGQIRNWLDNRLPPEQLAAFEAALDADSDFAEEVLRLQDDMARYREIDGGLHAAFPVEDAVPPALVAGLGLGAAAPPEDNVIDLAAARARRKPPAAWRWVAGGALAASVAIAVLLVPQLRQQGPGAADGFQLAMSQTPSANEARLADGGKVRPTLSFAAADGRWCREFEMTARSGAARSGIACRTGKAWSIEASVASDTRSAGSDRIRTAAGTDTASLDATYDRLGGSDPIVIDKEKDLIANGWPKSAK